MKLIIDIPKDLYAQIYSDAEIIIYGGMRSGKTLLATLLRSVRNGTPLDDVKVEIKAMFPPSGKWMYDEECEHEHTVCEVLIDVLQILDNIGKAESEE